MRIGFDFDNTIVSYDKLFYKVAAEQGLLEDTTPMSKVAVRDYLRHCGKEDRWTEIQGIVYGARMQEAEAYPGVIEIIQRLSRGEHTLSIISHKSKYPYLGKQYDLHQSARKWIDDYLCVNGEQLIPEEHVFFEHTKEDKLKRIRAFECDVFFDDLPEILLSELFPDKTQRYLFDPDQHHSNTALSSIIKVPSWTVFESCLL